MKENHIKTIAFLSRLLICFVLALVGPPANVSVQALSNDSVVVQWDFDEQLNGGLADGFVVKVSFIYVC
jgi:hypothetical protein